MIVYIIEFLLSVAGAMRSALLLFTFMQRSRGSDRGLLKKMAMIIIFMSIRFVIQQNSTTLYANMNEDVANFIM